MSTIDPVVTATRYEVSCLPPDHCGYRRSIVVIETRGHARGTNPIEHVWAVSYEGWAYDVEGEPSMEPRPSERTPEWLERHRHDLDTATAIARLVAHTVAADLTRPNGGAR